MHDGKAVYAEDDLWSPWTDSRQACPERGSRSVAVYDVKPTVAHKAAQSPPLTQRKARRDVKGQAAGADGLKVGRAQLPAVVWHDDGGFVTSLIQLLGQAAYQFGAASPRGGDDLQHTAFAHAISFFTRVRHSSSKSRRLRSNGMRGCQPVAIIRWVGSPRLKATSPGSSWRSRSIM